MKYLYIDSKNAAAGSGNSYSVWFSDSIKMITGVDLVCARIPNTMYNIQDGSNVFSINSTPINMAPGFYSTSSFVTDANLQTNMVSLGASVSYLTSEGKFIFTSASPFTFQTRYGDTLGFVSNTLITSQLATSSNAMYNNSLTGKYFVKSSNIIDLSTTSFAFLDIEQIRDSSMVDTSSPTNGSGSGGNVRRTFGPIPLNVPSGYIKTFTENGDYKLSVDFETPIRSLEKLNLTWKDYTGNTLIFNGFDNNSILLRFRCA